MPFVSVSRHSLLLAGILAMPASHVAVAAETLILNFGVYSSTKPSAMVKFYRPLLQELENVMTQRMKRNVDIRLQIAKDNEQGISHLVNGRVDFSAFGPSSFVKAKDMNYGIRILAIETVNASDVIRPWIARSGLDPEIVQGLRDSLLNISDPNVLAALNINGFSTASDDDYRAIPRVMDNNLTYSLPHKTTSAFNDTIEPPLQAALTPPLHKMSVSRITDIGQPSCDLQLSQSDNEGEDSLNITPPLSFFEESLRSVTTTARPKRMLSHDSPTSLDEISGTRSQVHVFIDELNPTGH